MVRYRKPFFRDPQVRPIILHYFRDFFEIPFIIHRVIWDFLILWKLNKLPRRLIKLLRKLIKLPVAVNDFTSHLMVVES